MKLYKAPDTTCIIKIEKKIRQTDIYLKVILAIAPEDRHYFEPIMDCYQKAVAITNPLLHERYINSLEFVDMGGGRTTVAGDPEIDQDDFQSVVYLQGSGDLYYVERGNFFVLREFFSNTTLVRGIITDLEEIMEDPDSYSADWPMPYYVASALRSLTFFWS